MTGGPPPYPRTPHLWPPVGGGARLVLPAAEAERWLSEPVVVEEKLDGANVSLWWESAVQVASRGGPLTMDRGGQLGRLRAWAAERASSLQPLLADGWVLYAEWLWLRHGVSYDQLPDWLIALDLWHPDHGFVDLPARDERCARAGLHLPPRLFSGVLGGRDALLALLGPSRFSVTGAAEGLVLRGQDGQRCKVVSSSFARRDDVAWAGRRQNNRLASTAASCGLSEGRST